MKPSDTLIIRELDDSCATMGRFDPACEDTPGTFESTVRWVVGGV